MTAAPPDIADLALIEAGLPDWWGACGNRLFAPSETVLPEITCEASRPPPNGSTVVLKSADCRLKVIRLWGDGNRVEVGRFSVIHDGVINCGDGGSVIFGDRQNISWAPWIDARNGGSITVGEDGLWSSQVRVATDDMHAIVDLETGRRVNARGSHIRIGAHVWIGMDAVIMPGVTIGERAIIGIRAVVAGDVPARAVAVGVPARVVRTGVSWTHEDLSTDVLADPRSL